MGPHPLTGGAGQPDGGQLRIEHTTDANQPPDTSATSETAPVDEPRTGDDSAEIKRK